MLSFQIPLVAGILELYLLQKSCHFFLLKVHCGFKYTEDGVKTELVEGTLKSLAFVFARLGPFLGVRIEVTVTLLLVLNTDQKQPRVAEHLPIDVPSSLFCQHRISLSI